MSYDTDERENLIEIISRLRDQLRSARVELGAIRCASTPPIDRTLEITLEGFWQRTGDGQWLTTWLAMAGIQMLLRGWRNDLADDVQTCMGLASARLNPDDASRKTYPH